jgi:hypothetical protein
LCTLSKAKVRASVRSRVITAYALDQLRLGQRALRGCQRHPARIDRDEKNIDVLIGIGGTIEPSRIDRQRPGWTLERDRRFPYRRARDAP